MISDQIKFLIKCYLIVITIFFCLKRGYFKDFVNTRLLVKKHVKISVVEWILKITCLHKRVIIFGIYYVSIRDHSTHIQSLCSVITVMVPIFPD